MSDIFGYDEPLSKVICNGCKHYLRKEPGATCRAFMEGIPKEILIGKNNHSIPLDNQKNAIVFEPKD